jgi:hypothetical protein
MWKLSVLVVVNTTWPWLIPPLIALNEDAITVVRHLPLNVAKSR